MAISDTDLQDKLQTTLEPLYKAHMSTPDETTLSVTVTSKPSPGQIYGELTMGSVDFDGLDSQTKSSFTRTFNTLAQTLDPKPNRVASGLDFLENE
jgi:hypothetical protein